MSNSTKRPIVSVLVAVLNRKNVLEDCITSVLEQTSDQVELIIADGGSTDGTLEIIEKYRKSLGGFSTEADSGIYAGLNKAWRLASGKWGLVIGSDDRLASPTVIEEVLPDLEHADQLGIDLVYGKVEIFDPKNPKLTLESRGEEWRIAKKNFSRGLPLPHPSTFQSQRLLDSNRGFDETYKIAADYKLILGGCRVSNPVFIPRVISRAANGGVSSISANSLKTTVEMIRARAESGVFPLTPALVRNAIKYSIKKLI